MDIYDPIAWIMLHATVATIYAAAVTLILLKEKAADTASIDYLIGQLAEQSKTPTDIFIDGRWMRDHTDPTDPADYDTLVNDLNDLHKTKLKS